ncbi:hypothetical protein [Caballeronia sp. TF1N1]|uniref:hypothetical protein n=1 Tax=Caballeronia sp. TF1N1 TaxID=2878153 RepID=UPI001FD090D4|nr:hypothetical protein [Caballeronia sp. TF1N1]
MEKLKSICLLALGFLAGMLIVAFIHWPPTQSSDWASWMQAIGAIVGIGIAIAVPAYQKFEARRESRNAAAASLRATAEIVRLTMLAASDAVDKIARAFAGPKFESVRFVETRFEELADLTLQVEIHTLPTPGAVKAMVEGRHATESLRRAMRKAKDESISTFFVSDEVERAIVDARDALIQSFNELVNECVEIEKGHARWSKKIEHVVAMKL